MWNVGDSLTLGIYISEGGAPAPIEWIVCQVDGSKIKLISKNCIFKHPYKEPRWKDSSLRYWLNSEAYESIFSDAEKKSILETITVDNIAMQFEIERDFEDGKTWKYYDGLISVDSIMSRDRITIPSFSDLFEAGTSNYSGAYFSWKNEALNSCSDEFYLLDQYFEWPSSSSYYHPQIRFGDVPKYFSSAGVRICVWVDSSKL